MKKLLLAATAMFAIGVTGAPVSADATSIGVRSNVESDLAVQSAAAGECVFEATLYPGDSVTKTCTVTNLNPLDMGMLYHIKDIVVRNGNNQVQSGEGAETFKSYFKVDVESQMVLTARVFDVAHLPTFRPRCTLRDIDDITPTNKCKVMRIRGTSNAPPYGPPLVPNQRDFRITIHFLDVENQTAYAGWYITFTEVYGFCIPAGCVDPYLVPID